LYQQANLNNNDDVEEAISNSSSPLENEKIKHNIEQLQNKGKIDLPVNLTE